MPPAAPISAATAATGFGIAFQQYDRCAFRRHFQGNRAAQPLAGAADEAYLAVQQAHVRLTLHAIHIFDGFSEMADFNLIYWKAL